jgi:glycosyltransferase involved in cell wall biosynthesis
MAETQRHTVVIATILKPVDDVRGYEKIGRALADSGLFRVHLIGSSGSTASPAPNTHFHSLGRFDRLSWARWTASFRVLGVLHRLRPELLIIATHELVLAAVYAKFFMRSKIVYDIQENYFRNILYTNAFPFLLRGPLALYIRLKELMCSRFFDLFVLAEKVYKDQLSFARKGSVVLENKAIIPDDFQRRPGAGIELVFSGTLGESTGVFEAIRLASLLHDVDESVKLHIVGYCPNSTDRIRLKDDVKGRPFITLTGIDEVLPHATILKAISSANFGIVCYPRSPHTEGRAPTKVYEYLACRLPVLASEQWASWFEPYQAAVVFNSHTHASTLIASLRSGRFYQRAPTKVLWKDEEGTLIRSLSQLVKDNPGNEEALG